MMDLVRETKKAIVKDTAANLAKQIIAWVSDCFARIKKCITTGTLDPLWGRKWDPDAWIRESEALVRYYNILTLQPRTNPGAPKEIQKFREEGILSSFWTVPVTPTVWMERVRDHMALGKELESYYKASPHVATLIERAAAVLRRQYDAISTSSNGLNTRVAPMAVMFYGIPGTGKTNLCRQVIDAIGQANGLSEGGDAIYDFQEGVNFQDKLQQTHWAIVMDDVDHSPATPQMGVRSYIDHFNALVNNKPYEVEKADLESKGQVRAAPLFVGFCTNFPNGMASEVSRAPSAFYRRFKYYVEVGVKPKYQNENLGLDPKKALASDTYDMYEISVSKYFKHKNEKEFKGPATKMSFPELVVLLQDAFKQHLEEEIQILASREVTSKGNCPVCHLPATKKCNHPIVAKVDSHTKLNVWFQGNDPSKPKASVIDNQMTVAERIIRYYYREEIAAFKRNALNCLSAVVGVGLFLTALTVVVKIVNKHQGGTLMTEGPMKEWFRVDQPAVRGMPIGFGPTTWTKDELVKAISSCHLKVSNNTLYLWAMALSHNTIIVPTHIASVGETIHIHVQPTFVLDVRRSETNWWIMPSNPEISLVRVPNLPGYVGVYRKIPHTIDESVSQFDEVEIIGPNSRYLPSYNTVRRIGTSRILCTDASTQEGDCGFAYIARKGDGWKLVGIHYALRSIKAFGATGFSESMAAMLSGMEIARVMNEMQTRLQGVKVIMESVSKIPDSILLGKFSKESEVWAAQTHHGLECYTIGNLTPPLPGSTMKTKVKQSLFYNQLQEIHFEEKMCGVPNYWRLPQFRGKMIDEKWTSPFTNMFATQNLKTPDDMLMMLALCDYVAGMDQLNTLGYKELTTDEALRGVPASYIGSVNMSTSVGPPYTGSKRNHVVIQPEEAFISPEVMRMLTQIEECLKDDIPSVLGLCTLKDEAVKLEKLPRVFICLPFAFNLAMKKRASAWKSFMRANPEFFESMVGINMTSSECNKIISILQSVSPNLDQIYDGDVKAMDKSWSGAIYDQVARAVYAMSHTIGVCPEENERLLLSLKHVTYAVKNDLIRLNNNPSGCDVTVEINGLAISLCERYVYYASNPFSGDWAKVAEWHKNFYENPIPHGIEGLVFRDNVALVHYGDDNLKAMRFPPSPEYENIWKDQVGMIMLPADKSDSKMRAKKITEVSFLKRDFVWDEDLGLYKPPLSVKSLARMLLLKKDSILSDTDHAATVLTEYMKESVYHGKAFYEEQMIMANDLVNKNGLKNNSYLDLRTYETWFEEMREGNFQTWSLRPFAIPGEVNIEEVSYQMNNISLAKGAESAPMPVTTSSLQITHDTGSITGTAPMVVSAAQETPVYSQSFPTNSLDDFLLRQPTCTLLMSLIQTLH